MSHYEQQQEKCFRNFTWEEEADYKMNANKAEVSWVHEKKEEAPKKNKYNRLMRNGVRVDVYDILDAFGVENPAVAHAIKKMLCAGQRGYKDFNQDIDEAIESLERAKSFPPVPF